MLDQNPQPKAFDSKMIVAVLVVGLLYMGWQQYLLKKYPDYYENQAKARQAETVGATSEAKPEDINQFTGPSETVASGPAAQVPKTTELQPVQRAPQLVKYEDEKVSFQISSAGMAIQNFLSKAYSDREQNPINLTPIHPGLFEMTWGPQKVPISFDIQKVGPNEFKGTAKLESLTIERSLVYDPKNYSFSQQIRVLNPANLTGQFALVSRDKIQSAEKSSWLFPSYEHQDLLTFVGDRKESTNISHATENLEKSVPAVSLYSVGTQYFTVGYLEESELRSDLFLKTDLATKSVVHSLVYKIPQAAEFLFRQKIFIGPRSSDSLKAAHENFSELIDYGMLGWISKPLLASMKWFYSLVGNWGFAIILLTLLVRALVLPFNLMSYRSMKGMQKIQPVLAGLREKYKDDPVTLNREMMSTMKENNANPLAGCLPILLQIPIFFALYRVIGSSVELYQAPFIAWIQDLSLHDKFFVLPVLMGITMYIQQKLTPSTLDPVQAKVLTWMPVVFCLFMLNLPAGLTLYMVVSAVFGIVQQKTFMTLMKN
ncbi:MAG: membrane protein insertase YidC [Bdellovibrionales bacterium]